MGTVVEHHDAATETKAARERSGTPVVVRARSALQGDDQELVAHRGEIIGLAGLAGHGQTRMLLQVFAGSIGRMHGVSVQGPAAFIAGDRQTEGIFPLWSIARNVTVRSLPRMLRRQLVDGNRETEMAESWKARIKIRTPDMDNNILSLSGGNQQKAVFARALGSDAEIVLMDDPMRGVDVGTKLEVYDLLRAEAAAGRTFLWYTTEMDELHHCDHIYVFRNGRIVADLPREEMSEQTILQSSFKESA
jgi:ribose transport system ATP-binding protein